MTNRGAVLRARREALGLSIEDLSRRTRIPEKHLRALEEGREGEIPSGPYSAAYVRALEAELGLELDEEIVEDAPGAASGVPLWAVRLLATLSVIALLGLVGSQLWERYRTSQAHALAEAAALPDQTVKVVARRNTRVKVAVDGETVAERALAGGEELVFEAHDRIEVDVPAADATRIEYNGRVIVPQGRQDAPRRLVFVDDVQGRP